jgi:hypothetical protein
MIRGSISTEHTVWCVRAVNTIAADDGILSQIKRALQAKGMGCHSYRTEQGTAKMAALVARSEGWTQTRELGWVCPNCIKAYRLIKAKKK